jgi:hypothetical protein
VKGYVLVSLAYFLASNSVEEVINFISVYNLSVFILQ